MKFVLEIELDNEAMKTPMDIAKSVAYMSTCFPEDFFTNLGEAGILIDDDGNKVGNWEIQES